MTSLVAVADNVGGLVGKVQLLSCGFNVLLCTSPDRSHSVSKLRVSVLDCVSVTNRASFDARTFVIDESSSEKQASSNL